MNELLVPLLEAFTSTGMRTQVQGILESVLGGNANKLSASEVLLDDSKAVSPSPRPRCTLGEYIKTAELLAIGFASDAKRYFGKECDLDAVLAILLLGLVGRALEYEEREGFVRLSKVGQTLPEGQILLSAAVAQGMPDTVLNGLAALSEHTRIAPNSLEGTIAWYAARIVSDLLRQQVGLPLLMKHEDREAA